MPTWLGVLSNMTIKVYNLQLAKLTTMAAMVAPMMSPERTSVGWCLWSEIRERAVSRVNMNEASITASFSPERW